MLFAPTLKEVREFFYHAWHKSLRHESLAPIETIAVSWMQQHPEYHPLLNGPIELLEQAQFLPEQGQTNPFLHLSMHLSISEQIAIDQPIGIKQAYQTLAQRHDSEHAAAHVVMEALGQVLWQSQRDGCEPDSALYLELLHTAAQRSSSFT